MTCTIPNSSFKLWCTEKKYNLHRNNSFYLEKLKIWYHLISLGSFERCLNIIKRHHRSVLKPSASLYLSGSSDIVSAHLCSFTGSFTYEIRSLPASQRQALVKPLLSTAVYHLGLDKVTLLGLLSALLTKSQPRKKSAFHLYHQQVPATAGQGRK